MGGGARGAEGPRRGVRDVQGRQWLLWKGGGQRHGGAWKAPVGRWTPNHLLGFWGFLFSSSGSSQLPHGVLPHRVTPTTPRCSYPSNVWINPTTPWVFRKTSPTKLPHDHPWRFPRPSHTKTNQRPTFLSASPALPGGQSATAGMQTNAVSGPPKTAARPQPSHGPGPGWGGAGAARRPAPGSGGAAGG